MSLAAAIHPDSVWFEIGTFEAAWQTLMLLDWDADPARNEGLLRSIYFVYRILQ